MPTTIERAWPEKQLLDALDYPFDMTNDLDVGDGILSVTASVAPSGELSIGGSPDGNNLIVTNNVITVWLQGGVGGRFYIIRLVVFTSKGRTFDFVISLPMSRTLMVYPTPDPPSTAFSGVVTWTAPNMLFATANLAGLGQVIVH